MTSIFREGLLADHVAIVTGGGTGIGLGIATALAGHGAAVAIASRRAKHLDPAAEELRGSGHRVMAVPANVREPDSVQQMVQAVVDAFGRIDILVNNAAGNFYAPSADLSPNGWRAVIETDLYGTFFCSQAVYPHMASRNGGRIISISMTLHHRGWPQMAHATAAKAGVDALTRTLALEWARDQITVNAIAPGPIPTGGAQRAFARGGGDTVAIDEAMRRAIPLGRWGSPDDIANMTVYLASPAAAWITGAILVVDGGSSLAHL
ncbi:MAG: SDR family oxidoreductase [Gemmatimonadales bacterium]|jgi:peroxisomal 2,4-dienoyl-CoA reductase